MDKTTNVGGYVCSGISLLTGGLATDEIVNLTLMIVGIISGLLSISLTIYKWIKVAKADGKITVDEVIDVTEKVKDGVDNIKGVIENEKDKRTNEEDR